ncbi:MAG: class I SAM-dependent methyltransferase [Myxococcota bacterium]
MVRLRPRRLDAGSHEEAYDLWARHFADPALMANRDAETNRRKLERVAEHLPVSAASSVLDVGPGDGALLRILAARVAHGCGVDPSEAAIVRLRELFAAAAQLTFRQGSALDLPFPDASFDTVVVNSVLHMLPEPGEVRAGLAEAVRVCRPGGVVWVGELPFRAELARGIVPHMMRKLREYGPRAYARLLYHVYLRPVLRGEPVVLYPARNTHVPRDAFETWARELGCTVECFRHRELQRPSETRNDYRLTRARA